MRRSTSWRISICGVVNALSAQEIDRRLLRLLRLRREPHAFLPVVLILRFHAAHDRRDVPHLTAPMCRARDHRWPHVPVTIARRVVTAGRYSITRARFLRPALVERIAS